MSTYGNVILISALLSQVISNVPATIVLSGFTHNYSALSWGVNLGGNGLIPASLANIIALRLAGGRNLWFRFHFYSIPFFLITLLLFLFLTH